MAAGDEIPVTIEYRRILFGAGTLIDPTPICKRADDECCADEGDPTCCDGEFARELAATLSGPLDGSCGPESIPLTLTWDTTNERWYGEANNALATYQFRVWFRCVNGVYLGTVQVFDAGGVLVDASPDVTLSPTCDATPATLDGSYTPVENLAPCLANVSLSIDHPCPEACGVGAGKCCPEGFSAEVSVTVTGVGTFALIYDATFDVWVGSIVDGVETFVFYLWCDGGWVGWIDYFSEGALVASGASALTGAAALAGTITVDATGYPVSVVHPCSDPGGAITACGCEGVSATLYATFGGTLAAYGTQTLTHVGGVSWLVTPASGACNGGVSPIGLTCAGGNVWRLSTPGHAGSPSTVFSADATPASCSPLSIAFSGTATGTCAGAWTATVSEIAP